MPLSQLRSLCSGCVAAATGCVALAQRSLNETLNTRMKRAAFYAVLGMLALLTLYRSHDSVSPPPPAATSPPAPAATPADPCVAGYIAVLERLASGPLVPLEAGDGKSSLAGLIGERWTDTHPFPLHLYLYDNAPMAGQTGPGRAGQSWREGYT